MKRKLLLLLGFISLSISSCSGNSGVKLLSAGKSPADLHTYNREEMEKAMDFTDSINSFGSKIASNLLDKLYEDDNQVISPFSIYAALGILSELVTFDGGKDEILDLLEVDQATLRESYSLLHYYLEREGEGVRTVDIDNSLWVQENYEVVDSTLDLLSENYYNSTYWANFAENPAVVSQEIKNYINEKTRGLLSPTIPLTNLTRLVILNTLYLKDRWILDNELDITEETYDFTNEKGEVVNTKLLETRYFSGQPFVNEEYRSFRISTAGGIDLTFILPNDGYTFNEVLDEETILECSNRYDYNYFVEEEKTYYYTRVFFPEFSCETESLNLVDTLNDDFGLNKIFDPLLADFSPLVEDDNKELLSVSLIQHGAKVVTNKEGIEGGAYTSIMIEATSPGYEETKDEFLDFIVDKQFGYIVTYEGCNLFTGFVNNIA